MKISRRNLLVSTLFGAGYVGLRSLATGVPASILTKGRRAFADGTVNACGDSSKYQYIIMSTSSYGDPINANVPGAYGVSGVYNNQDPTMAPTALSLGGVRTTAASPWAQLPQPVLDRATFWHLMTNTPVHPKQPDVLSLQGATTKNEMLPSALAAQLAPCLHTVQTQPITVGANNPSEGLRFAGSALPILPPLALKATLTAPNGPLSNLRTLREDTLGKLADLYKQGATAAQARYVDSLVKSDSELRGLSTDLLGLLGSISDNGIASQITAALALIQMNVTPVVCLHIPFGGDNHFDTGLATEAAQTVAGVQAIGSLMSALQAASLQDKVTFISLNVFGRTLGAASVNGRQHNPNHQVSITIGKPFRGGVLGGVAPVGNDYGALDIDSTTGAGRSGADINALDTLASFGKTVLTGSGVDSATTDAWIPSGKVIAAALA
jgi:hypothetical protein